jgi:hypothetical protein
MCLTHGAANANTSPANPKTNRATDGSGTATAATATNATAAERVRTAWTTAKGSATRKTRPRPPTRMSNTGSGGHTVVQDSKTRCATFP